MKIIVNGTDLDTPEGGTVLSLLESKKLEPSTVVVEKNGDIVPGDQFATTRLGENDKLEILRFVGGG